MHQAQFQSLPPIPPEVSILQVPDNASLPISIYLHAYQVPKDSALYCFVGSLVCLLIVMDVNSHVLCLQFAFFETHVTLEICPGGSTGLCLTFPTCSPGVWIIPRDLDPPPRTLSTTGRKSKTPSHLRIVWANKQKYLLKAQDKVQNGKSPQGLRRSWGTSPSSTVRAPFGPLFKCKIEKSCDG